MPVTVVPLSEFLRQYDGALEWLGRHGVRTEGTRLASYRREIAGAVREEAHNRFSHQQRPELVNALIEASEMIDIALIDESHLGDVDTLDKLRRISGGPETMVPDRADPARDYAFEFHTAAALQRQGGFGGFSQRGGDLMVTDEQYPAECKRVSSLNSVRNRLRGAKEKLTRLVQDGSQPGVITIDLTRPVRMAHGQITAASDEELLNAAGRRLTAYLAEHVMTEGNIASLQCSEVLGVIARCLSAGTVGEAGNVRRSVVWQACSVHWDGSTEDLLFRRVASAFGPGEMTEGTREDILNATAEVPVVRNRRR